MDDFVLMGKLGYSISENRECGKCGKNRSAGYVRGRGQFSLNTAGVKKESGGREQKKNKCRQGFGPIMDGRKTLHPADLYFHYPFSYNDSQRQTVTERKNNTWQSWEDSSCSG